MGAFTKINAFFFFGMNQLDYCSFKEILGKESSFSRIQDLVVDACYLVFFCKNFSKIQENKNVFSSFLLVLLLKENNVVVTRSLVAKRSGEMLVKGTVLRVDRNRFKSFVIQHGCVGACLLIPHEVKANTPVTKGKHDKFI
jgi:hypothetical protein